MVVVVSRCPLTLSSPPRCVLRCGHGGGLYLGVRSGRDKPPPLSAQAGPEERRWRWRWRQRRWRHQRGQQTQHVHGLQDRAAPPQLSQGQHEGVLHLTTACALRGPQDDTNLPLCHKRTSRWTRRAAPRCEVCRLNSNNRKNPSWESLGIHH